MESHFLPRWSRVPSFPPPTFLLPSGSTPAPSSGGTVRLPAVAIEGVPLTPDISGVEVDFARLVVGWSRCDAAGDTKLVSRELTYTPVAEDVGCDLLCTVWA